MWPTFEGIKRQFRAIIKHRYQAIILVIIIFASLVLLLRGAVQQRNATQIEGTKFIESIDGNSLGPQIWGDNLTGQSPWQIYPDNGTQGILTFSNGSLNLTAFFPGESGPLAVSIYRRPINVSIDYVPIAFATVHASQGIHYGMRFSGVDPGNVTFDAWYESDPLQHRLGHGTEENLTSNLALNSYLANGRFPPQGSSITSIKLYLEATPGQTGWFSLTLSYVTILSTQQHTYEDGGDYNGLIVHLSSAFDRANSFNQSLFQVYAGFRIDGTPNLLYRLYFNRGLIVEAEGYTYHLKPIIDYEEANLLPSKVRDFPSVYSDTNQFYVSVVALQGSISYFKLDTLTFELLPQTLNVSGDVDTNLAQFLYSYYILFLFILPTTMVVVFWRTFEVGQEKSSHS